MINRISKKITPAHTLSPADLLNSTGATYDDACVVWGHSPVDIDSHKLSSWKVVHQCVSFTLVNDISAAQFVTINVDGTVTS